MGNAWVFPSTCHSTGKCNKTHPMGKTWEIGNHTFPIAWVLFSHPIPILSYTSSYGKCMGFPTISQSTGKCNKIHHMGRIWEIGTQIFSIVWVLFSLLIPILWYTYYMGNAWVLPTISHSTKKSNKTYGMGRAWKIGTHTFPIV